MTISHIFLLLVEILKLTLFAYKIKYECSTVSLYLTLLMCLLPVHTCLEIINFPRGIGAPFSVAIRFKVAIAFS